MIRSAYPTAKIEPTVKLPAELDVEIESHKAIVDVVRGRISHSGPLSAEELAALISLDPCKVAASLEAIEGEGLVLRGQFTDTAWSRGEAGRNSEWCERRLWRGFIASRSPGCGNGSRRWSRTTICTSSPGHRGSGITAAMAPPRFATPCNNCKASNWRPARGNG